MTNLYNKTTATEILHRIDALPRDAQREWGTMNVDQMLAHCVVGMEVALGRQNPPRIFFGRILGSFIKGAFYDDKPFRQNTPTAPSFVVKGDRDFEKEKAILKSLVKEFAEGGPAKCTTHPHAFFGTLNTEQWSTGIYKHLDHHLRQFGG